MLLSKEFPIFYYSGRGELGLSICLYYIWEGAKISSSSKRAESSSWELSRNQWWPHFPTITTAIYQPWTKRNLHLSHHLRNNESGHQSANEEKSRRIDNQPRCWSKCRQKCSDSISTIPATPAQVGSWEGIVATAPSFLCLYNQLGCFQKLLHCCSVWQELFCFLNKRFGGCCTSKYTSRGPLCGMLADSTLDLRPGLEWGLLLTEIRGTWYAHFAENPLLVSYGTCGFNNPHVTSPRKNHVQHGVTY